MIYSVYTDGACSRNPGPGGYAFVILAGDKEHLRLSGSRQNTTNNFMELLAIVRAMKHLQSIENNSKENSCVVYSDSAYCLNPINQGWVNNWVRNGWKTNKGDPVKNAALWQELLQILSSIHMQIKFVKVKGHSGNKYNELVDKAAKNAIKRSV